MPGASVLPEAGAARAQNRVRMEPLTRELTVRANSFNAEQRTFEVVWSTGAEGRRYGWAPTGQWLDQWIEELGMEPENVDLSRLNNGAPLCDSHYWMDLHGSGGNRGVIGVVEQAWLESGQGLARARLSGREDVAPIARDVQDGILRKSSIGYEVSEWEETTTPEDAKANLRRFKAIRWTPFEISLVSVPFDDGAGVRTRHQARTFESLVHFAAQPAGESRLNQSTTMPPDPATPAPAQPAADPTRAAAPASPAPAAPAPAARAVDLAAVRSHVRRNQLGQQFEDQVVDDLVTGRCTEAEANARILLQIAQRSEAQPISGTTRVLPNQPDPAVRDAVTAALLHRVNPGVHQLPDTARRWRSRSLVETARELLEMRGISTDLMSRHDIIARSLSSSDFPSITLDVANKVLRAAYAAQPRTFLTIGRRSTLSDFKQKHLVKLGEAPDLAELPEGGEIKAGSMVEGKETIQLKTYARKLTLTRQMIYNDDLDAFTKLAQAFGIRASVLENNVVWAMFTAAAGAGATMGDGIALFHANHKNLNTGAGSALSVDGLGVMRKALRNQVGLDGATLLNLELRHLVVPSSLETKAQQLTTRTNAAKDSDVNPFVGAFQSVVVEPRLDAISATAFIGVADPGLIDTLEYAYLEGSEGVHVETQEGWNSLGVEIRAFHDFGAALVDHRGFQRNAGA